MPHLDALLTYVRAGTAEGDKLFLGQVFATPKQLDQQLGQLLGIEAGGMRLLVGNKGMGKSAIVERLYAVSKDRKVPCVILRPDNLETQALSSANDTGSLKKHFFEAIVTTVAAEIGTQLSGLLVGENAVLHSAAQAAGLLPRDAVQKTLTLLSAMALPVSKVNAAQFAKELTGKPQPNELIRAIQNRLLSSGSVFFLLIDDTDQVASPSTPAHLNRIWALLLAVRRLASECPSVRAIVTLRSEVWNRLVNDSDGQRDQIDHVRGLVVQLRGADALIEDIVRRRLERAAADSGVRGDPYKAFFTGDKVTLPSSNEQRSWDAFISKSSRERPRDALQLIKNMIDSAAKNSTDVIGAREAEDGMKVYSKERVDDLHNEFSPDCQTIREVIKTFADLDFESAFEALRSHVKKIPSRFSLTVRGATLKPDQDEDAMILLSLLHECGFVNPRVADSREPKGFRHVLFQDDPNFVKISNWNEMQGATWEVHPAFRSFLLAEKKDALARAIIARP